MKNLINKLWLVQLIAICVLFALSIFILPFIGAILLLWDFIVRYKHVLDGVCKKNTSQPKKPQPLPAVQPPIENQAHRDENIAATVTQCKICGTSLVTEEEQELGICSAHALILESDINGLSYAINKLQPLINNSRTTKEKLPYVKTLLEFLYEFKIKYINNDVEPLDQDIDDLIMNVLEAIPPD